MATLVLGTVGRVFGGPVGGIIGTAVGGLVDRTVLGGGSGGNDRIDNLLVQSAAYGEAIPVVTGRMRVAGNLIWSTEIVENAGAGSKRNGGSASAYTYTASFAVGLAAREIEDIGRIWADGRLIRDADGVFLAPTVMRLHRGTEQQQVDPLIAAAEGPGGCPAYRGLAYVVFEDLVLVDFGNRIPNLTFELIADTAPVDIGSAIEALAIVDGRSAVEVAGSYPSIVGHFAGSGANIADSLQALLMIAGGSVAGGEVIRLVAGPQQDIAIGEAENGTHAYGAPPVPDRRRRLGGDSRVDAFELGYFDIDRDYQSGLQRARRGAGALVERQAIGAALSAGEAKSLAHAVLGRLQAGRLQIGVRLPWRHLGIAPGALINLEGDAGSWRVRQVRFEAFVVQLDLQRVEVGQPTAMAGASGRALQFTPQPAGPTTIEVFDLPALPGEQLSTPRLWVAAAGASAGWRRAAIEISADDGASYHSIGTIERQTVMGTALTKLPAAATSGWDRHSTVDVMLLSDRMWLEGRSDESVLAGANLALIGNELLQFATAEAVAPRTFRLSGLLRGRRGSEAEVGTHADGERFVLIDEATMLACPLPVEVIGTTIMVRPAGVDDAAATPTEQLCRGNGRPLSPVHLGLELTEGDIVATWLRRSPNGFGWNDFIDAPMTEGPELYRVSVCHDGTLVRVGEVASPRFVYSDAMRRTDGGGCRISFSVCQISAQAGPGDSAAADIYVGPVGECQ